MWQDDMMWGENTVERWNAIFAIKDYFEVKMGCSVYDELLA